MKNILLMIAILFTTSVHAADKNGIYIRYEIQNEDGKQLSHATADYYFQRGRFLAQVNFGENMMGEMIFLESGGKKYSLFPSEKTYVEIKEFSAGPATFQPESEGEFVNTGMKKKVLGYKCDIYRKETKTEITNVCLSAKLYKNWAPALAKINQGEQKLSHSITNLKGFPVEIVTLYQGEKKQTTVTMTAIKQRDYSKRFDIIHQYKKKNTEGVQVNSTKMINTMQSNAPQSQQELDKLEKLTDDMQKKYKN